MKLFVLSTPSQAFFLNQTTDIIGEDSILLITQSRPGLEKKVRNALSRIQWHRVIVWDFSRKNFLLTFYKIFLFRLRIAWLKSKYRNINELYIGSYNNLYHIVLAAAFERSSEIFLLYDGLQMVTVAENRKKNVPLSIRPLFPFYRIVGLKKPLLPSITYITPLNFTIPDFDNLLKISPTTSSSSKSLNLETMYFAGQPLVDLGVLKADCFLEKLRRIKKKFSNLKIIYIPHPKESPLILSEVEKIFELQYLSVVFEKNYLESPEFPKYVISFYSSVLVNMLYLNNNIKIYAIELKEHEIHNYKDSILTVYNYLQNGNITLERTLPFLLEKNEDGRGN